MTRHVYVYPGAPVPERSKVRARVIGLAACIGLGFAIGWRLGR